MFLFRFVLREGKQILYVQSLFTIVVSTFELIFLQIWDLQQYFLDLRGDIQ
jgi:hypothetical protein